MLCISANHYILCFVIPTMGLIAFPLRRGPVVVDWIHSTEKSEGTVMLDWTELEAQCLSCQRCALADAGTMWYSA